MTPVPADAIRRNAITLAGFAALSVSWSWPLARDPGGLHVYRQFDHLCTLWVAMLGAQWDGALTTALAGWPEGQALHRLDSLVLFLLARIVGPALSPGALLGAVALAGPVLSAWAAERFAASVLGVRWPASALAGLTYGFSGMAATGLLEGHVYTLFNPWLPLLAWQWHRATSADGRIRHGVLAGVAWALCLLTTAYAGVAATLWVLAWGDRAWRRRHDGRRPLVAAAAVVLPVGLLYVAAFVAGGPAVRQADAFGPEAAMRGAGVNFAALGTFAGATPATDLAQHSIVAALGFVPLALLLAAPRVRPAHGPWRRCLLLGGVALLLALGPPGRSWLAPGEPSSLHRWLAQLDAFSFFRFPVRLVWITALAWGGVAAAVLDRLLAGHPRRRLLAGVAFAVAVVDLLLVTGLPGRTARVPWQVPSAYAAVSGEGAVLALLPEFTGPSVDLEQTLNDLECAYQTAHGRPLLNRCVETTRRDGPRWAVGSRLRTALLAGETGDLADRLAELGIGTVVWRPDLFFPGDRATLGDGLVQALGPPVAESADAGDHVVVFQVASPAARAAARERWRQW